MMQELQELNSLIGMSNLLLGSRASRPHHAAGANFFFCVGQFFALRAHLRAIRPRSSGAINVSIQKLEPCLSVASCLIRGEAQPRRNIWLITQR
jgi:hypothetical protein